MRRPDEEKKRDKKGNLPSSLAPKALSFCRETLPSLTTMGGIEELQEGGGELRKEERRKKRGESAVLVYCMPRLLRTGRSEGEKV